MATIVFISVEDSAVSPFNTNLIPENHGGVTGVKESAFMGVPMLLIPLSYDEFGNAARVVYHGLGTRLRLKEVSVLELGRLIDRLLEDSSYSARAKIMSEKLSNLEQQSPGVAIIEDMLRHKDAQKDKN